MKTTLRSLISLVVFALALLLVACGGGGGGSGGVAGDYEAEGAKASLTLKSDSTFTMDTAKGQHISGTWSLDGAKLTLKGSGEGAIAMTVTGTVSGTELSLQFGPTTTAYRKK